MPPYVSYGVKYIDLVSLAMPKGIKPYGAEDPMLWTQTDAASGKTIFKAILHDEQGCGMPPCCLVACAAAPCHLTIAELRCHLWLFAFNIKFYVCLFWV